MRGPAAAHARLPLRLLRRFLCPCPGHSAAPGGARAPLSSVVPPGAPEDGSPWGGPKHQGTAAGAANRESKGCAPKASAGAAAMLTPGLRLRLAEAAVVPRGGPGEARARGGSAWEGQRSGGSMTLGQQGGVPPGGGAGHPSAQGPSPAHALADLHAWQAPGAGVGRGPTTWARQWVRQLLHGQMHAAANSAAHKAASCRGLGEPGSSQAHPQAEAEAEVQEIGSLGPTGPGEKPRVVVLGSGWAACRFLKDLDTTAFDVVGVSPRNHMVFTPLLTSTCVGTLEFRSVAEPVEVIQPALSLLPHSHFFLAHCVGIDTLHRKVLCEAVGDSLGDASRDGEGEGQGQWEGSALGHGGVGVPDRWRFSVAYDKLVIAVGACASTFGIEGVHANAFFLREVHDAQMIRRRLLLNLMKCDTPGLAEAEKRRLLSCVVVGGGPTGVEFSGELGDFIRKDVRAKYAHVKDYIHVTLIEAREILSSFDVSLREYAVRQLTKAGVSLVKGQVREVGPRAITLTDGTEVPYGLLVWSTGVGPSRFTQALPLPKSPGGRIAVDEHLAVVGHPDVFALGDCSGYAESTGKTVLPALAQVAERQGKYLAHRFNSLHRRLGWGKGRGAADVGGAAGAMAGGGAVDALDKFFVYRHLGSMATIGRYRALVDLRESKAAPGLSIAGFVSFLIWRSAYLTRVISWRNRLYVMVNWATTMLFGRDISRI